MITDKDIWLLGAATGALKNSSGTTQEVTGSTPPPITAASNTRYICGEVSTLSFTPPAKGSAEVIFTSGSSPTILTLPATVKMPEWFDATDLESNRTYDIMITDGVHGAVMSWPL